MSPDADWLATLPPRLDEAVDVALLQGLIKYNPHGGLAHAPFALTPSPLSNSLHRQMERLTAPFNRLALCLAQDSAFLQEVLAPAARTDPFTARLLQIAELGHDTQPLHLALTRSDYFVHQPDAHEAPLLRQVELNTISASYPGLSALVSRLHRYLLAQTPLTDRLPANDPLPRIAETFAEAHTRYGVPDARVLMVVQPGETNVFDQRLLEMALREHGLIVRRLPLDEVARRGSLRNGHLVVAGDAMAIAYFRAAYGPEDFETEDAFRGRELIEASSAIAVPTVHSQLAGAKKVQQVITQPGMVERYLRTEEAEAVRACFAAQHDLEQPVQTPAGPRPAWQAAQEQPAGWVLKPQREGGGHNYFDQAMADLLGSLSAEQRASYVLMERIRPAPHDAILVRERTAQRIAAVSEIGRFGVHLADGRQDLVNEDVGYLVRSKSADTLEGGVSAGFGYLDSLLLDGPASD